LIGRKEIPMRKGWGGGFISRQIDAEKKFVDWCEEKEYARALGRGTLGEEKKGRKEKKRKKTFMVRTGDRNNGKTHFRLTAKKRIQKEG